MTALNVALHQRPEVMEARREREGGREGGGGDGSVEMLFRF